MGDANHTPEVCAERAAYLTAHFHVGDVVKRDDGCYVLVERLEAPSCGGYIEASGRRVDMRTGELTGSCRAGYLSQCAKVARPANLREKPCLRQGC